MKCTICGVQETPSEENGNTKGLDFEQVLIYKDMYVLAYDNTLQLCRCSSIVCFLRFNLKVLFSLGSIPYICYSVCGLLRPAMLYGIEGDRR